MEERLASAGEGEIDRQTSENNHCDSQHESSITSKDEIASYKLIQDEIGHKKGDTSSESSKKECESMVLGNGMKTSISSDTGQENKESNEATIEEQKRTTQEQPEAECASSNHGKSENCEKLPFYNQIDDSSDFESRLIQESIPEPSTTGYDEDISSQSCNGKEKSSGVLEGGSHRSPDRQSKVEYRKIKSEVTGEGETSESEGENDTESDKKESDKKQETTNKENVDSQETWIDMLGNGLLRKRILREGKGQDTRPDKGQIVTIQAAGRTDAGVAVDWNNSLEFILGDGEVIQAFDLAVALMELDEVCELVTDAKYAYGKAGKPQATPPILSDATLTYEIQLLAVRDGPNVTNMSDDERLKIGEKKRELGNDLYSMGDYSGAINSYHRAIKYLGSSGSQEVQTLRLKCWNNMAAAQLRIKAYSAAEKSCSQVLQVDPENVKALFRKGKVLAQQGETNEALVHIKKADQLDPSNRTIRAELNRLKQVQASEQQNERSLYRRMVGDLTSKNTKKNSRTFLGWPLVLGATVVALGGILVTIYLSRH